MPDDLFRAVLVRHPSMDEPTIPGYGKTRFPEREDGYTVEPHFLRYIESLIVELNNLSMNPDRKRDVANLLGRLLDEIWDINGP